MQASFARADRRARSQAVRRRECRRLSRRGVARGRRSGVWSLRLARLSGHRVERPRGIRDVGGAAAARLDAVLSRGDLRHVRVLHLAAKVEGRAVSVTCPLTLGHCFRSLVDGKRSTRLQSRWRALPSSPPSRLAAAARDEPASSRADSSLFGVRVGRSRLESGTPTSCVMEVRCANEPGGALHGACPRLSAGRSPQRSSAKGEVFPCHRRRRKSNRFGRCAARASDYRPSNAAGEGVDAWVLGRRGDCGLQLGGVGAGGRRVRPEGGAGPEQREPERARRR